MLDHLECVELPLSSNECQAGKDVEILISVTEWGSEGNAVHYVREP